MIDNSQIYRVGGYVRDKLLGMNANDCDYVVVGSTPEEMLRHGFTQVGRSFPVFLHPQTKEEYALARCEKKISSGHTGFVVYASPDVTLEEDLKRRDITINAIAEDCHGALIDPYGGLSDLQNHTIRHVSEAFSEDPLRILRVARFATKLNFSIATETRTLLKTMATTSDIYTISRERIIEELNKSLSFTQSSIFFITLREVNCLDKFFPSMQNIMNNDYLWDKLITITLTSANVNTKLFYLGMLYHEANLSSHLAEIINSSKIITSINKGLVLLDFDIGNLTSQIILEKFKQLDIWRNYNRFLEVLELYDSYVTKFAEQKNKVNTIKQLAASLHHVDLKSAIATSAPHDIAINIKQQYLAIIDKFKLGIVNHD